MTLHFQQRNSVKLCKEKQNKDMDKEAWIKSRKMIDGSFFMDYNGVYIYARGGTYEIKE